MSELFEFDMSIVDRDRDPYYVTRWDRATPLTITAATKQEAADKACALMGDAPRGRYWLVRTNAVRSRQPTTPATERTAP